MRYDAAVTGLRLDHPLMGEGTVVFVVDEGSAGGKPISEKATV